MEKKTCGCKNGGCGKNAVPERISVTLGEREITNRDLLCRNCVYKKRGDTASCFRYEKKPDAVFSGTCEFFLQDGADLSKGACGECSDGCKNCSAGCSSCHS